MLLFRLLWTVANELQCAQGNTMVAKATSWSADCQICMRRDAIDFELEELRRKARE